MVNPLRQVPDPPDPGPLLTQDLGAAHLLEGSLPHQGRGQDRLGFMVGPLLLEPANKAHLQLVAKLGIVVLAVQALGLDVPELPVLNQALQLAEPDPLLWVDVGLVGSGILMVVVTMERSNLLTNLVVVNKDIILRWFALMEARTRRIRRSPKRRLRRRETRSSPPLCLSRLMKKTKSARFE